MKLRDLQQSHDFRVSVKKWGAPLRRRRIIVAPGSLTNVGEKDVTVNLDDVKNEQPLHKGKVSGVDKEIEEVQAEREELRSWVKEKRLLREGLNSLSLSRSLLENKPDKTELETRVLQRFFKAEEGEGSVVESSSFCRNSKLSPANVDALPLLDNPLPIALAIIADYLQEHRMRLLDLFSKADRNKDWLTTRGELHTALKDTGIPLTDAQIDELVNTLDVNNDDHLSYKELAMGIDAYRKDRRWKKLKEIFDVLIDKADDAEQGLTDSFNERKTAMDLLRLPKFDNGKQNMELADSLGKRNRPPVSRRKRKVKIRGGIKTGYITTLSGMIGDSKVRYLEFIDNECKRCIEQMHRNDLPLKSEDLVNILIPPSENPRVVCESYVGSNRSIFPFNHRMNRKYRSAQKEKINGQKSSLSFSYAIATPMCVSSSSSLPRVATLDFKNRAKEGRQRREQLSRTSPTPCWPQHLLDKLRIYMDNDDANDGKDVLFAQIKQT